MKTRNVLILIIAAVSLILSAFTASAQATSTSKTYWVPSITGTSTNTERDTFLIAATLSSKWTGSYQFNTTSTSGTRNAKVYIYESTTRSGTAATIPWVLVDSTSAVSATVARTLKVRDVNGARVMLVVSSTGPQVTPYSIVALMKTY
jgi:hypothetical protein